VGRPPEAKRITVRLIQARRIKGNMKAIIIMGVFILMTALRVTAATTSTKDMLVVRNSTDNVNETIAYLLDYVSKSDFTFIRNGEPHTGVEASAHFKSKYEHFTNEIKTPEDFIQMAAT